MHLLGLLFLAILFFVLMIAFSFLATIARLIGRFRNLFSPLNGTTYNQPSGSARQQQAQQQSTSTFSSHRDDTHSGNAHHESTSRGNTSGEKIFSKDEGEYVDFEEV